MMRNVAQRPFGLPISLSFLAIILVLPGFVALPVGARAQDQDTGTDTSADANAPAGVTLPKTPVTLNVESADLYYTLKLLFQQIHADFTLDTSLRGMPVTVKLTKVPFDIALSSVLKASGQPLTYSYENGIFSIIPQAQDMGLTNLGPGTDTTTVPETKPVIDKIFLSVVSFADVARALGFPVITTLVDFGGGGGMGGGFGGGFGGGGMGGFGGGMGGFGGGGMGGFGGGMGGMGGFGGGMGGFGGGGFGGGLGGFGGGGFGGGGFGGGRY